MKTFLTTMLIAFILSGCNSRSPEAKEKNADIAPAAMMRKVSMDKSADEPEVAPSPQQSITDTSKKLVKTGSISFETSNLYGTRKKILIALGKLGGYASGENETNDTYRRGLTLQLRVPSKNFDRLLDSVSGSAKKIDSKNVSVSDVTSQFIDIKTGLNNQKLLEKRYQELLNRANKMSDVLQIENKLTEIRTTIDSTQGNLNYLSKQVAYSTLEVNFYSQQTQQYSGTTAGDKFGAAFKAGWALLQDTFFAVIALWPLAITAVIVFFILKKWRRTRKLKVQQV